MRLRDLRWHILASIIIIFSYAAISFCYYLSIKNGKVEDSMKSIAQEVLANEEILAESHVKDLYEAYQNDTANQLIATKKLELCKNQDQAANKVALSATGIYFGTPDETEGRLSDDANTDFYFYFGKTSDDARGYKGKLYVKVRFDEVFTYSQNNILLVDKDGFIKYTYDNSIVSLDSNFENNVVGNESIFVFNDYIKQENKIFSGIIKVKGKSYACVLMPTKFVDIPQEDQFYRELYMALLVPTHDALLGSDWVIQQALIFFFAGVLVVVGLFAILLLGCKKASMLLRADRHAVQKTQSMVIRITPTGKVIFTNQTFKKMYGAGNRLTDVEEFIDVETNEPVLKTIKQNRSFECSLDNGEEIRYLHLTPLYISSSYYLMGTDITTDYLRRKHLEIMSGKNEVTECDNGFILANQFQTILEANLGYDLAFIEYNITKYDEIISVFGRTSYNLLLKDILSKLEKAYGEQLIFHMDDAKFMVVYPNSDINTVTDVINETLTEFQKPFTVKQNNIYVKVKVIVYNLKQVEFEDMTLATIKTKLDLAYRNISNLSSRDYIIYDPTMDSIILAADEMEKDIESGLINNEFEMYLQPQFDIVSNQISGFEALIRWQNPRYKDKSPQIFIELAEQRGHMLDIGKFVISESFKLAKKLEPYETHVSVNVSPVQLLQVGFVQQLIDEFNKLQLKPGSVAIEITETLLMENFHLVIEKLRILKEKGFHIHLDDFCTGYSSMLYLKDLPVDTLKIDKEFTKYIETNKVHENIVKTICTLANNLNLGIVCEGVETQTQSDMVKKMGCRTIQGYLIGKAMKYDDAVSLIEKYRK